MRMDQFEEFQHKDQLSIDALINMIKSEQPLQLIDVRNQDEHEAGHIANSMLIPLDTMESQLHQLDLTVPIVLYCRSGKRSQMAQRYLKEQGISSAINLMGGIEAWNDKIKEEKL